MCLVHTSSVVVVAGPEGVLYTLPVLLLLQGMKVSCTHFQCLLLLQGLKVSCTHFQCYCCCRA